MPGKFTIYKDKANKFRFNLKATNGEIIAASESYPDKRAALRGIASIVKNAPTAKIIDTTVEAEAAKPARGRKPGKAGRPASKAGRPAGKAGRPAGKTAKPAGRPARKKAPSAAETN